MKLVAVTNMYTKKTRAFETKFVKILLFNNSFNSVYSMCVEFPTPNPCLNLDAVVVVVVNEDSKWRQDPGTQYQRKDVRGTGT